MFTSAPARPLVLSAPSSGRGTRSVVRGQRGGWNAGRPGRHSVVTRLDKRELQRGAMQVPGERERRHGSQTLLGRSLRQDKSKGSFRWWDTQDAVQSPSMGILQSFPHPLWRLQGFLGGSHPLDSVPTPPWVLQGLQAPSRSLLQRGTPSSSTPPPGLLCYLRTARPPPPEEGDLLLRSPLWPGQFAQHFLPQQWLLFLPGS